MDRLSIQGASLAVALVMFAGCGRQPQSVGTIPQESLAVQHGGPSQQPIMPSAIGGAVSRTWQAKLRHGSGSGQLLYGTLHETVNVFDYPQGTLCFSIA